MSKKNFIYVTAIFFGIIDQLSNVSLFAIPIKSIKIIDNGTVFPLISNFLSILGINIITNRDQYLVLTAVFICLLLGKLIINIIRNELIKKIKQRKLKKIFELNKETNHTKEFLNQQLNVIDEFINFRTTLIFSAILLIFVISYDPLLSLILIMNCILNYILTTKIKSYTSSKEKKSELDLNSYYLNKVKNDYEIISYIKPFINTFTMFCIMTSVLTREEISISIILLFLIRIYLNKINDLIIKISDNSEIKKFLINKIKNNIFNI